VLMDPTTNDIRYVGQTNNINRRYNTHIASSLNKNSETYDTHKDRWIRKILKNNQMPIIRIVEECSSLLESNIQEKYYIEKYINDGYRLTNSKPEDVTEFSLMTREKMSNSRKGKKLEEIVGEEKSIELKKFYSERIKKNNPNKSNDPRTKEKISNTLKEFFTDKTNHWSYGLKMTDDHNEKLRQSKLNNPKNVGNKKPRTEEQKENIRNKMLGSKIKRCKILQIDEDIIIKEWNSLREIIRSNSTLNRKLIADCCKNIKFSYAGFIWKYKNED